MKVNFLSIVALSAATAVFTGEIAAAATQVQNLTAIKSTTTSTQTVAENGATFKKTTELAANVIKVVDARVIPDSTAHGATEVYMELDNMGKKPHTLIAAYSPLAAQTVLHNTKMVDHHSEMYRVQQISIRPRQDKSLHSGGLHVMLIDVKEPITPRSVKMVPIRLIFGDGSSQEITARVE